ncbi:RluA family pseudouridine synthase [Thermovibrio sp.]
MEKFKVRGRKGEKLIEAVAEVVGSKKKAKRLIDEGLVSVNFKKELFSKRKLKGGEVILFPLPKELFKRPKVKLLKRVGNFYFFHKPPFITSNEKEGSLEEIIRKKVNPKLQVAHRLDKQTTGVILAVEGRKTFEKVKELFKGRKVKKEYTALLKGEVKRKLRITSPLEGKEAITEITPLERLKGATLCKVEIETGRKHQIRRHSAKVGHPLVGEFLYYKGSWKEELLYAPRIMLHSSKLKLGEIKEVIEGLPPDFKEFIETLR